MKDFVGKPIRHNDLVVSKPAGRYATMRYAIVRDEFNGVWFGVGSVGGSDIIYIETQGYPDLEKKRQDMILAREKDIAIKIKTKSENKKNKIKKKDFKRFGVYSDNSNWGHEIFLGACEIGGERVENVWMDVEVDPYNAVPTKENTEIVFWGRGGSYYSRGTFTPQDYRSVKYPQKFKEHFVLTKEEIDDIILLSNKKLKEHKDYSYGTSEDLIKIIF